MRRDVRLVRHRRHQHRTTNITPPTANTDKPPVNDREERKRVREQRQHTKNTLLAEKKRATLAALHQQQLAEHQRQEVGSH